MEMLGTLIIYAGLCYVCWTAAVEFCWCHNCRFIFASNFVIAIQNIGFYLYSQNTAFVIMAIINLAIILSSVILFKITEDAVVEALTKASDVILVIMNLIGVGLFLTKLTHWVPAVIFSIFITILNVCFILDVDICHAQQNEHNGELS